MRLIKLSVIMIFIFLVNVTFSACGGSSGSGPGDGDDGDNGETETIVYAAGYDTYSDESSSYTVAGYWKNGTWTALSDGTANAEINDIVVLGDVVFSAGYTEDSFGIKYAGYWENGTWTAISADSEALSLALDDDDVYICGYHINATSDKNARFWNKDNLIETESGISSANALAIYDGVVFYGGYTYSESSLFNKAGEWNFQTDDESASTNFSFTEFHYGAYTGVAGRSNVNAIEVVPADTGFEVYSAGYSKNYTSFGSYMVAGYWNSADESPYYRTWTGLSDGTTDANVMDIQIEGEDVYAAGYVTNSSGYKVAGYWKNGTWTALGDGEADTMALSLFVDGEDLYVGGYIVNNVSRIKIAGYWFNGSWNQLPDYETDSEIRSIIVTHE